MIHLLRQGAPQLVEEETSEGWQLPAGTVWIDLLCPSRADELAIEQALGLDLPTREEMAAIEPSSRFYQENGATYLTATVLAHNQAGQPVSTQVTFVLVRSVLITIRYEAMRAFDLFAARGPQGGTVTCGGEAFLGLLDAIVERLADVLEGNTDEVQASSHAIFERSRGASFEPLLMNLAKTQSVASLVRVSLISLGRLTGFAALAEDLAASPSRRVHLDSLQHDVQSLVEHSGFISGQISFLLDAALGLINIEQNGIIKFFSVAAVVLMPPTLVASVYGMNFRHMPELDWPFGYPLALGAMVISAIGPFLWFRAQKWL